jgi:hypothetical protein
VDDYVFPSRPTARWPNPKKPYRWEIGKEFRQLVRSLGIEDVRIHDLRHTGSSVLLMQGIPRDVVRKITGHWSRELERHQHQSNAGLMRRRTPVEMLSERPVREAERFLAPPRRFIRRGAINEDTRGAERAAFWNMAGWTGLEPATSDVTGPRSR